MKRLFISFLLLLSAASALFGQDIITKKDGTDIQARISEVGVNDVKYKKFNNQDGPSYTIAKSDILMITYENGERDVFAESNNNLPEGVMTLDAWTGRLSINGMNIDRKSTHLYFSPETEALFKSGDALSTVGEILIGTGCGAALGYLISSYATSRTAGNGIMYTVCGGLVAAGVPMLVVGLNKINAAMADYNSKHGFASCQPELNFGLQNNGIGLALRF